MGRLFVSEWGFKFAGVLVDAHNSKPPINGKIMCIVKKEGPPIFLGCELRIKVL